MTQPPTRQASTTRRDYIPVTVPFSATPAGEPPGIDQWAHRAVWTDRMVATLRADTVRGGKWHTLLDKVDGSLNLSCSAKKVLGRDGAAGVDRQTCSEFAKHEREELDRVQAELGDGTYRPAAVLRRWIPKPDRSGKRPLGIPTVRDRVVQTAVVHVLEPILDATFHERSFGFRHGRRCHDALRCVEAWLDAGYVYVVDADVQEYDETIPKDRLLARVQQKISDRRVLGLVKKFLNQGILEELREWTPEAGVPQGAVRSPVLSNGSLNPLDHRMADLGFQMVRDADDFVIRWRTPEEAEAALAEVRRGMETTGLTRHPEKTHIVDSREKSFSFLGYSFRGRLRFPRAKSHRTFIARIRELTPRKSGDSLAVILRRLTRSTQGWFNYFRHCFWTIFKAYDGMIRRRLRRMLLKRNRRNRQRLARNQRWPNAFFADHGFTSLNDAHMRFGHSIGTY